MDAKRNNTHTLATQRATRAVFLVAGISMSAWAPLVPFARERLGVSDASLGSLLLFLGAGSLIAMPLTGWLVARFGCKNTMLCSSLLIMMMLPLLAILPTPWMLALALALFGAGLGTLDVAMNFQAVEVEKQADRPMMSGFHAFYSLGGIIGAGAVSLLLWVGLTPVAAIGVIIVMLLLLMVFSLPHLLNERIHQSDTPLFVIPRGWVAFLGLLCFILFLAEGAVLDWGALLLIQTRDLPVAQAGLGYAIFSVAMTIGRLTGDRVVKRFSRYSVMVSGCCLAALGIALAVWLPQPQIALLAFLLVGFGLANTVPMLFTAVGAQKTMPANLAISAMTTIGYTGILTGPALIGYISQWLSLSIAFSLIALLLLVVAASARLVTR
ncbi:MFS transporter [Duffyella gerundensis]|uniref:MFS transporter n=1 Tax=Duffyella gerundensis TaxID=1619313 RepID=UPI001E64B295|nr:MFS transporter [Duffyella gerundensis]